MLGEVVHELGVVLVWLWMWSVEGGCMVSERRGLVFGGGWLAVRF